MDTLLAISARSYTSAWYWIVTGVAWSLTCHVTLGVPYDMLVRAHKKGGESARDAEELARIHVRRVLAFFGSSTSRIVAVAILCFLFAMLATFGFYYGYEIASAAFMLLAPLAIVQAMAVRLAFRIRRDGLDGEDLRNALVRRRFWNQVIGLFAITATALVAFLSFARQLAIWY